MRESLSYGMFPLLPENMDTAMLNSGSNTLISFNGYYGYQPQINPPDKGSTRNENQEQARNDRMDMDVQSEESDMQMQMVNVRRHINRKRRSEHVADIREFKKRRDCSDAKDTKKDLRTVAKEENVLEDILMGTHGVSLYHWMCERD
ncbi:uncharacterized protein isoform X2 [Leptinotarsa decemlineata]|uniref:uncharacterized protein isoform X2 n=1 Tax=Leptinotarsa decemlineata TaxID=7539 RepID=UPI000C25203D|nr:uncharacterized protein LOC111505423 isoform X2 [Leptinotarsa decemlineata]